MNRTGRIVAALLSLLLLAGLIGSTALWLRAQRRQYALNRALIDAVVKEDDRQALALITTGADPNTRYKAAPVPSLTELVKQIFHRSAPPINQSPTALQIACGALWDDDEGNFYGQKMRADAPSLVGAMLTHGADVNAKDGKEWTALFWAARDNRHGVLDELLQHGAHVNAQDQEGFTALSWTWDKGSIRQLLAHGADLNLTDNQGATPIEYAQQQHHPEIVALLKQYGARDTGKRH